MKRYVITVGSVTQAIKGRDILRKNGFKVTAGKSTGATDKSGCAYAITIESDNIQKAKNMLMKAGIRIKSVN